MKTMVYKCEKCSGQVSDADSFCVHCGAQFDSIPMFKVDKEKLTIKFISIATMKDFISESKIKPSMYKVIDKERAIIQFINYSVLKEAEKHLDNRYTSE